MYGMPERILKPGTAKVVPVCLWKRGACGMIQVQEGPHQGAYKAQVYGHHPN
jgi:hypothetical protein